LRDNYNGPVLASKPFFDQVILFVINFESFLLMGKLLPNFHKQKFHPNCLHFCCPLLRKVAHQMIRASCFSQNQYKKKWQHRIAPHSKGRRTSPKPTGTKERNTKVVSPLQELVDEVDYDVHYTG
jgi:hypothetical protein